MFQNIRLWNCMLIGQWVAVFFATKMAMVEKLISRFQKLMDGIMVLTFILLLLGATWGWHQWGLISIDSHVKLLNFTALEFILQPGTTTTKK